MKVFKTKLKKQSVKLNFRSELWKILAKKQRRSKTKSASDSLK